MSSVIQVATEYIQPLRITDKSISILFFLPVFPAWGQFEIAMCGQVVMIISHPWYRTATLTFQQTYFHLRI
jgi:hypothetical protein